MKWVFIVLLLGMLVAQPLLVFGDDCPEIPPLGVPLSVCWEKYSEPEIANSYVELTTSWDDCSVTVSGWCADPWMYIGEDDCFTATLLSSFGAPEHLADIDWNKINYILNQWLADDSELPYKHASWMDVQQAIWIYTEGKQHMGDVYLYNWVNQVQPHGNKNRIQKIWQDARGHSDFIPDVGEPMVVIVDHSVEDKQLTIFTIPLLPDTVIPETPLGTISVIVACFIALLIYQKR